MDSVLQDIRYAVRTMLRMPGFAATAILTLALGIGANTVIFSVVDAVLLRPLPFQDTQRLAVVWERRLDHENLGSHGPGRNVAGPANLVRWREQSQAFESFAAGVGWPMNLTGGPEPERVQTGIVTANLFSVLGVDPVLGRGFLPEEEQKGKDDVLILSRGYWQRRFGGDPSVIGRTVQLNGTPVRVVGVMPDFVKFPADVQIWTPFSIGPQTRTARGRSLVVVGRLKPDVSFERAQADMDLVSANTRAELKDFDANWGTTVVPLAEQVVGNVRSALYVLLGAVAFVLLIACANVANLLLARATSREREIGIRLALGASRARIVVQLLTESTLLSVAGGAVGLALAYWSIGPVVAALPSDVPRFTAINLNLQVLAFTTVIAVATGVIFGFAPALRVSAVSPQSALKEGGRSGTAGRETHRLRSGLVIAETATAIVLLAAGALLLQSFVRLLHVDTGFDGNNVVTLQVSPSSARYQQNSALVGYFQEAVRRIRTLPGVVSASAVSFLPVDGLGSATDFTVDDHPTPRPGDRPGADVRMVTDDYFKTLGIAMQQGRDFSPSSDHPEDAVLKVVVNRKMVDTFWAGQNPIGKRIAMEWGKTLHAEIIGVVGDVRLQSLDSPARTTLYWYLPQFPNSFMSFVVRTVGPPSQRVSDIRAQILSVDPEQPIGKIRTMDEIMAASASQPRFTILLLGAFAGLALLLAGLGLYGVMSYAASQRTHEMGVRVALGASRAQILRLLMGQGLRLALSGVVVGIACALLASRLVAKLLFNTRATEPWPYVAVSALLLATALLASYVPARRAASIEPLEALRYE
jgi:putative ABC transport system permease protein